MTLETCASFADKESAQACIAAIEYIRRIDVTADVFVALGLAVIGVSAIVYSAKKY